MKSEAIVSGDGVNWNAINKVTPTRKLNAERLYKVIHIRTAEEPNVHVPIIPDLHSDVKICLERASLVTESYMSTEGEPWILRRAKALDHLLRNMTIYILDGEQIVGNYASTPESLPTYPEFSYRWLEKGVENEFSHALDSEGKQKFKDINRYWENHSVESKFNEKLPPELKPYAEWTGAAGGFWHWPLGMMVLNYEDAMKEGLNGYLTEIEKYRSGLSKADPQYKDKIEFYEAAEICARAAIAFARRYAVLASEKAQKTKGKAKEDYERIAGVCSNIPDNPPATFHEALQTFYFYHLITTQIDWNSVGLGQRFDQLFYPFYRKDLEQGGITYERAVELFEYLWIKLDDLGQLNPMNNSMLQVGGTKFQAVTIGGVDKDGNDATNELSFAILDATINIRTLQPSLSLRYHDNINPDLVSKAIDCIASGTGMPAVFNDNVAIPWTLYAALTHLYPESGKYYGLKALFLLQSLHKHAKKAVSIMPDFMGKKIEDRFHNWPLKLCTGGGIIGDALRRISKPVFDAEEIH